jgi:hypothetical protein
MKSIIFLIISSDDHPIYTHMKDITRVYMNKMKSIYPLNYYFLECKDTIDDLEVNGDTIFVKGQESIRPGILLKTQKAMNYINHKYEYDIVVRTNLSSFWNIPHLFELSSTFPETLAGGMYMFSSFISGTGIILSKSVCVKLVDSIHEYTSHNDDVLISEYLKSFINIYKLPEDKMYYLIDGEHNKIPSDMSNILYFRIKSFNRDYDILAFKELAKRIYSIDI